VNGFIAIHRKIMKWEWYNDSTMVHFFLHLLLSANHAEGRFQGILIKRGQLITGRKKLARDTGISEQSIRTCIKRLKSTREITIVPTNHNSLITICNYETYALKENFSTNKSTMFLTSDQPATNQQLTTNNKNNKNNKLVKLIEEKNKNFSEWKIGNQETGL